MAFDLIVDRVYIHESGYVSLQNKFTAIGSGEFPTDDTIAIVAPFYGRQDMSCGGSIYYQAYYDTDNDTNAVEVLNKANEDVELYDGSVAFNASQVIVVTWLGMQPSPCSSLTDEQLVIL